MPSDLLAASARLRKFHGLTGGSSKWHSSANCSAYDSITALAPRRATHAAADVQAQRGTSTTVAAAENDEALAQLQRRVQKLSVTTEATLEHSDGEYGALRLDGPRSAAWVLAAAPAARLHVVAVGGRHRSDLTRGISLLRRVKAAEASEDALASPLARAVADFGGSEGCASAQAGTALRQNYSSAAHEPTPDASSSSISSSSSGSGSSRWKHSRAPWQGPWGAGNYFQGREDRAQQQEPSDARALAAAPASVSAVRSTYRRRRREVNGYFLCCVRTHSGTSLSRADDGASSTTAGCAGGAACGGRERSARKAQHGSSSSSSSSTSSSCGRCRYRRRRQ
jgi:hypothetical protein